MNCLHKLRNFLENTKKPNTFTDERRCHSSMSFLVLVKVPS